MNTVHNCVSAIDSGRGVPRAVLIATAKAAASRLKVESSVGSSKTSSKFQELLDEPFQAFSVAESNF